MQTKLNFYSCIRYPRSKLAETKLAFPTLAFRIIVTPFKANLFQFHNSVGIHEGFTARRHHIIMLSLIRKPYPEFAITYIVVGHIAVAFESLVLCEFFKTMLATFRPFSGSS